MGTSINTDTDDRARDQGAQNQARQLYGRRMTESEKNDVQAVCESLGCTNGQITTLGDYFAIHETRRSHGQFAALDDNDNTIHGRTTFIRVGVRRCDGKFDVVCMPLSRGNVIGASWVALTLEELRQTLAAHLAS